MRDIYTSTTKKVLLSMDEEKRKKCISNEIETFIPFKWEAISNDGLQRRKCLE